MAEKAQWTGKGGEVLRVAKRKERGNNVGREIEGKVKSPPHNSLKVPYHTNDPDPGASTTTGP